MFFDIWPSGGNEMRGRGPYIGKGMEGNDDPGCGSTRRRGVGRRTAAVLTGCAARKPVRTDAGAAPPDRLIRRTLTMEFASDGCRIHGTGREADCNPSNGAGEPDAEAQTAGSLGA